MFELEKIALRLQRLFDIEMACYEQEPINKERLKSIYIEEIKLKAKAIEIANAL